LENLSTSRYFPAPLYPLSLDFPDQSPFLAHPVLAGMASWGQHLRACGAARIRSIGPVLVAADGRYYAYSYIRLVSDLFVVEGVK
jgi:hypothetical protein